MIKDYLPRITEEEHLAFMRNVMARYYKAHPDEFSTLTKWETLNRLYFRKWMNMGNHLLTTSLKKDGECAAPVTTDPGKDVHAAPGDVNAAATDVPAALRNLLDTHQRLTCTATYLTALLKDTPFNAMAVTNAAWDHADAGGVASDLANRIYGGAADVTAGASATSAAAEDIHGTAPDAHVEAEDIQDLLNALPRRKVLDID